MRRHSIATILAGRSTLLREGLARILVPPKFRVVASEPSVASLDVSAFTHYDGLLLVIELGDGPVSEIEHITRFKREHPTARVAVLASRWRPVDILAAFQAGANVYFAQVTASEEFLKAIELVMLGQSEEHTSELQSRPHL